MKLRLARLAGSLAEQDIIIRIGIERRVEINEINARVGKNLGIPQPLEIVTEKESVHGFDFMQYFGPSIQRESCRFAVQFFQHPRHCYTQKTLTGLLVRRRSRES